MKPMVIFAILYISTLLVSGEKYHPNFAKQTKRKVRSVDTEEKVEGMILPDISGY